MVLLSTYLSFGPKEKGTGVTMFPHVERSASRAPHQALFAFFGLILASLGVVTATAAVRLDSDPMNPSTVRPSGSGCVPTWNLVASPNVPASSNYIAGISAASPA